jgi:hypothetical protein
MSELIRELMARLPSQAIQGDFVDERSVADLIQQQYGNPQDPTAVKQLRDKAQGTDSRIQLDR